MDLGSIQAQLKDGQYDSFDAFDEDVHLVIDNCKLYNAEDSDVYKQAVKLDKLYASQCKKLLKPEQAAATPASGGDKAKAGGLASAVPDRPKSHLKASCARFPPRRTDGARRTAALGRRQGPALQGHLQAPRFGAGRGGASGPTSAAR